MLVHASGLEENVTVIICAVGQKRLRGIGTSHVEGSCRFLLQHGPDAREEVNLQFMEKMLW
jgi:hypothetical protein